MKIVLASTSAKKVDAVNLAFAHVAGFDLTTVKAPSNVHEQPIGDETFQGATNRLDFVKSEHPDADVYISIENGLFMEDGEFVDKAVVTIETSGGEKTTTLSNGVVFPFQYVAQTSNRDGGFKEWTVGKIMAEEGVVKDDADPHLCLSGKSRVAYLNATTATAVNKLNLL